MTVSPNTFSFVLELMRRESAIQLVPGKEYLVESRLLPLARELGFSGEAAVDRYIDKIRHDTEARQAVVEALTTNETSWFRDKAPFRALRNILLPEVRERHQRELRIWSAACSTGQEPYSIAMALLENGEENFSIIASDLSRAVLATARKGEYSQLEINRGMPATLLVRYFSRAGAKWKIADRVRETVTFCEHNLLRSTPVGGPFDVVFLRNVLIYFDEETKRRVLASVSRSLRPGGYLVLGTAERVPVADGTWEWLSSTNGAIYRLSGGTP